VGLIIAFSISGIALNHRTTWNPRQYVVDSKEISLTIPEDINELNDVYGKQVAMEWNLEKQYQSIRVRGDELRLFFDGAVADVNTKSGKGVLETVKKRPLLNEMTLLHQTTDKAWIWYSDIFGMAMLLIAISGMFIAKGSESFRKRGWKFALIGIVFPLIFLLFLA
jgi:hypothetical protein